MKNRKRFLVNVISVTGGSLFLITPIFLSCKQQNIQIDEKQIIQPPNKNSEPPNKNKTNNNQKPQSPNVPDNKKELDINNIISNHLLSKKQMANKSVDEILIMTERYKFVLNHFRWWLKNSTIFDNERGVNFKPKYYSNQNKWQIYLERIIKQKNVLYRYLKELGFYGLFGTENINLQNRDDIRSVYDDLFKWSLTFIDNEFFTKEWMPFPKYLNSNFDNNIPETKISEKIIFELNTIISENPFGFLPSNLSQYLELLIYKDISEIFDVGKITNIQAKVDDQKGEISILITSNNQKIFYKFNKNNLSNLKNTMDYYKFIYDRTAAIKFNYLKLKKINDWKYVFIPHTNQGTLWIVDRVENQDLENRNLNLSKQHREYEFILATNLHILDLRNVLMLNKHDEEYESIIPAWNSWFTTDDDSHTSEILPGGIIVKNWFWNIKVDALRIQPTKKYPSYFIKYDKSIGLDKIIGDRVANQKIIQIPCNSINSSTYFDNIIFTPKLESYNTLSYQNVDLRMLYGDKSNYKTDNGWNRGKLINGGADFALTKVKLTGAELDLLFPELAKIIDTEKEKNWYVGLGVDNKTHSSEDTTIIGGFASGVWDTIVNYSGFTMQKERYQHPLVDTNLGYWSKYDDKIAIERIKPFDYEKYNWFNEEFPKLLEKSKINTYHKKGMELLVRRQIATYYTSNYNLNFDKYTQRYKNGKSLGPGSSGSMAINSRFEVVGINFARVNYKGKELNTNVIQLFNSPSSIKTNHHGQINDIKHNGHWWDGSIKNLFIKQLEKNRTFTYKIRPKNK